MIIKKKYKLEKLIDPRRPEILQNILVDKKVAVSTNGKALAMVPIEENGDNGLQEGLIDSKSFSSSRQAIKGLNSHMIKIKDQVLEFESKEGLVEVDRPSGQFPNYKTQFIKNPPICRMAINPYLLVELADALGCDKNNVNSNGVILEIINDSRVNVIPESRDGAMGIIMLKTIDGNSYGFELCHKEEAL